MDHPSPPLQGQRPCSSQLGHKVDLAASFFTLYELEDAATAAGLATVTRARRPPYENEGSTVRLYMEAVKEGA